MTRGVNKAIPTKPKRRYFMPTLGRVVEAEDIKSAIEQAEAEQAKDKKAEPTKGDIKNNNKQTT